MRAAKPKEGTTETTRLRAALQGLGDRGDAQGVEGPGEAGDHDEPEDDVAGGAREGLDLGGGGLGGGLLAGAELGEAGVEAHAGDRGGDEAAEDEAGEVGDDEDQRGLADQREGLHDGVDEALDRAGGLAEAGELQHADDDEQHEHVEDDVGDAALERVGLARLAGGGGLAVGEDAEVELGGELVVEAGATQAAIDGEGDELGDQPAAEEEQQREQDLLADDHAVARERGLDGVPPGRSGGDGRPGDGRRGRGVGEAGGPCGRSEQQGQGTSLQLHGRSSEDGAAYGGEAATIVHGRRR
jgi:hypothetical protein